MTPLKQGVSTSSTDTPAWKRRPERSTPWMLAIIVWVARHLGRGSARVLLLPIVFYFYLTSVTARRASRQFLGRALERPARAADVLRNLYAFAVCALDRVFLLAGRHHMIHIERCAPEAVRNRIHDGGALLLTSHLGSFDALRVFGVDKYDMRFRIVMNRLHAPMITSVLESLNPKLANEIIDSEGGPALALALREALDQHCVIGMMADRLTDADPGIVVPFMGKPAHLPVTPWRWAAVLGAPVLLCFGLYRGGNLYELHFELFSEQRSPVPRAERTAHVEACIQRYATRLEHYARKAPYNWFNFYDFWSDDATRH